MSETSTKVSFSDTETECPLAAVIVIDECARVVAWSDTARAQFGWTTDQARGRPLSEVVPTADGRPLIESATDLSSRVEFPPRQLTVRHRDGTEALSNCTIVRVAETGDGARFAVVVQSVCLSAVRARQREQQWLHALVHRGSDVAFVIDATGRIVFVADVAEPPLGYRPNETMGRQALDFVHPDDRERAQRLLDAALSFEVPPEPVQLRGQASDGSWRLVEVTVTNLLDNPAVKGLVVNMRDITERRAMEEALRASEARYRGIVETAQEGIWLLDETGRTLFANRSLAEILHRDMAEVYQLNVFEVVDEDAQAEAQRRLRSRRHAGHEVYEISFLRGDGEQRWASVSAGPLFVDDDYVGSLLMISDITERKRTEADLERRALYDDLTGLPNRTLLHDRLGQAMRRRSTTHTVAVFFIDLDDFKAVNDSYGHEAGDELLQVVAERLGTVVREGDTLARFAGDEFVMVCPDVEGEIEADALAQRMLQAISQPVAVHGNLVSINASVGVSLQHTPSDGDQMVRDADLAMFEAKKRGRGRHVMFDAQVARQSRYHLEDVHELRVALDHDEVEVFFQPQVDMATGSVCSVEALARWRHPQRGLLEPSGFIGLAEASGLIVTLGRQVLESACAQAAEWARMLPEPLPVAVNISARQLDDENLPLAVQNALQASELAPGLLRLEITETAVMSDADRARRVLHELHDQGIRLAIDDFGTGYSSLMHLKRLPVDEIKIDRAFVDGLDQSGDDRSIVAALINMAKALDLRVVGEGVETKEQADALVAMGCRVAQGYLYAPPVEARRITAWFSANR